MAIQANYNEVFKETFEDFTDYYVIIGGTATSFILDSKGLQGRSTKDYDMAIIKRDQSFYKVLTDFLEAGQYVPRISEKEQLYRFTTTHPDYPSELELFSEEPFPLLSKGRLTPLPFGDDLSLSALLLDTDYYDLLTEGREIVAGYSVLRDKYLIVFKAKAWLDMRHRKANGMRVDSRNIKKHLNDIARLTGVLEDTYPISLPQSIQSDLLDFLTILEAEIELIPQNKDIVLKRNEILEVLQELFSNF